MLDHLEIAFAKSLHRKLPPAQISAFRNSLQFMSNVVRRSKVADTCSILIEYMIPLTSRQIDFLIAGEDEAGKQNLVIVELKQWTEAEPTEAEDLVVTPYYGKNGTTHPSYQANSYRQLMADFNENINANRLSAYACAYMHNFKKRSPEPLVEAPYENIVSKAPLYFEDTQVDLEAFIKRYVRKGHGADIIRDLESGRIRPSRQFIEHVSMLYENNSDFVLLDEQKVAFERAKLIALKQDQKTAVIIKGGPGTGKSVISVNLLGALLQARLNTRFIAPNASYRKVMMNRLTKDFDKRRIESVFGGSTNFVDSKPDTFDCLIVDEAHRLKDGRAYMYRGQNQVEDIIKAAKTSVFFIDDDQAIRDEDIGSVAEIKRIAAEQGMDIFEIELTAQFRCGGAEGYINWINDLLKIKETANYDGWDKKEFEFKIFDDPNDMHRAIIDKDIAGFNARMLAGFAWKWTQKENGNADAQVEDVTIPEYGFRMPWNSHKNTALWADQEWGRSQIGCIHTTQGLEFDYVGVIIGPDIKFNRETLSFYADYAEYKDTAGKKGLKNDPAKLSQLIRNIYKVLLTRGMKGCYVWVADVELREYLRERLHQT